MSAPDRSSSFNLEHLKKHAKRVLRACRTQDPTAIAEMRAALPRLAALDAGPLAESIQLADVHQALARQHGFSSWADLIRHGDPLARLLAATRGGHVHTLRRELADFAGLAAVSVHAACAVGDATALVRHLALDRSAATTPLEGWPPIMHACGSPVARFSLRHATSLADCVDLLLEAGADANATAPQPQAYGGQPAPPMVRAMMSVNLPVFKRLRDRGVPEPSHLLKQWISKSPNPEAATLHMAFGEYFRRPDVREAMKRAQEEFASRTGSALSLHLDPRDTQQLRLPNLIGAKEHLWKAMLDRGFDFTAAGVGGQSPLHSLVRYAPAEFVRFFLARGGNPNVRDEQGRSVLVEAVRAGNIEVTDLLRSHGVIDEATLADRLIGACLSGDGDGARAIAAESPTLPRSLTREDIDVLVRAAARGDVDQVTLLLDIGLDPSAYNDAGVTALHQAAWRGQVEMAHLLVSRGAAVEAADELYGETPHAWALHGADHADGAKARCLEIAQWLDERGRTL